MNSPARYSCLIQKDSHNSWFVFEQPVAVLTVNRAEDVGTCLHQVLDWVDRRGCWAAGFVSYEAASGFELSLPTRPPGRAPLIWFGIYQKPSVIPGEQVGSSAVAQRELEWHPSLARADYEQCIARLRDYIAAGDNYQTNFSLRLNAEFDDDPWELFLRMADPRAGLATRCAAYVDAGDCVVASASPELLFHLQGDEIYSRPMKGTAARGRWPAEDRECAHQLQMSEKNRAENVMIVDMVRNDLSRIARLGSVQTSALFDLERYPALWTMTSTVRARTDASIPEIFRALFPAASVTGAPKRRTMQIIRDAETLPRQVYTGSVGYIAPGRRAQFNVAIRTALVDRNRHAVEYGVGGGVVWDSTSEDEYQECLLKARVVTRIRPEFELLETLLWRLDGGFFLLSRHLARLQASADYFGFTVREDVIRASLAAAVAGGETTARVRLRVNRQGETSCEVSVMANAPPPWPLLPPVAKAPDEAGIARNPAQLLKLAIATAPVDSSDVFLFHKTTRRQMYDEALQEARRRIPGCADVLLHNRHGEVTETTICNVIAEMDGQLLTPSLSCGLLAGTLRAELLDRGIVQEAYITLDDLRTRVSRLWLVNSVRGWRAATA